MPWPGATLRFAFLLLLTSFVRPPGTLADGNVGCLFSERLCLDEIEWCYDDFAFGRCLPASGDIEENDLYRYDLQREDLHQISRELRRLFALGYRWSHVYTQCRLQALLYAFRYDMKFEDNACGQLIDQDLEGALKALEVESDQLEPQEVAIVRYTPSVENPHADFADEVYYPPISESNKEVRDIILPQNAIDLTDMEDPYAQYEILKRTWIPQMHRRSLSSSQIFSTQYNTPTNFRLGKETRDALEFLPELNDAYGDINEIYPLNQVLNEVSSDNDNFIDYPAYNVLKGILSKYEDNERAPGVVERENLLRRQYREDFDPESYPSERFTTTYNTPDNFRAGFESKDELTSDDDREMFEPRMYFDEDEADGYQEYGSGINEAADEIFRELKNLHRKYGGNFDTMRRAFTELQPNNILLGNKNQGVDGTGNFARKSERNYGRNSGVYTEGGVVYAPQDKNEGFDYKNEEIKDDLDEILEKYEMGFKRPERLDVKKPGPFFNKEEKKQDYMPTIMKKEKLGDEPDIVYIKFANSLSNWRQGNNILSHIVSLVHLDPSSITNKQVDRFEITFKVEQNRQSLNASEVAKRIEFLRDKFRRATGVEIAEAGVKSEEIQSRDRSDEINDILPAMEKKEPRGAHPNPAHDIFDVDTDYVYVKFKNSISTWVEGDYIIKNITHLLHLDPTAVSHGRVDRNEVTFRVGLNRQGLNASEVARRIDFIKNRLQKATGVEVTAAGVGDKMKMQAILTSVPDNYSYTIYIVITMACAVIAAISISAIVLLIIRRHIATKDKLEGLTRPDTEASKDYQDLCRARMAGKGQTGETVHGRITSLSRESEQSPSSRSSTSSWSEEPALHNMDISTGHMVLSYMEDHLMNKDRLEQEWVALCAYVAEPCETTVALKKENIDKNRYPDVMPYDHARVVLNELSNATGSDYINASSITDHDPRNPAYIAAQGPLPHTAPDFWQLIWEQGAVVIVMLTRLTEGGAAMCHRYWPEEGSEVYHIYEVHLVSEHIWCDDYLVRSFYLKNVRTGETRTVTQFHFLSWPEAGVPASTKALLEFRRKVNKSYRGRSCPIVVHCSDGAGRTGTYCLIDMVLSRMAKGAKEIDIAATLEHLRDQRPRMVATKQQFEFVLTAVAEEVHAILKALPPQPPPAQVQTDKEKEK